MQQNKDTQIDWKEYTTLSEVLQQQWREINLPKMTLEQVWDFYTEIIEPLEREIGEDAVAKQLEASCEDMQQRFTELMADMQAELERYDRVREVVHQQNVDEETTRKQEDAARDEEVEMMGEQADME